MAEAAFSEDGKYYSAITQDGRLRIWDTETNTLKQEYTPDLHLTSPPSCLQWINVSHSTNTPKRGKRNSNLNGEETQCIALGTTSGKILIYSITQAKVESVLFSGKNIEINQSKVNALDWSKKYGLFSCSKDNKVTEWDLQSASVRYKYNVYVENNIKQGNNINAIKIIPHNQNTQARFLVTASWQVRIWRLNNGNSLLIKSLGHNTSQNSLLQLVSLNESCWLIEGSQNERLLSFWDVTITGDVVPQVNGDEPTPNKRQRKKSTSKPSVINTPMYSFVLEDAPRIVDACLKEQGGAELSLAAATRSGVVHYYGHMLNGSSTKPIKPSVTIQVTSADAHPLPLQCCRLQPDGYLLLGYIKEPSLVFEKVTPELKTKTQVLIRDEAKVASKKIKQTNEVNKVRSDANTKDVSYVEPLETVSRKRTTPGGQIEVPMEARLENLALDTTRRSKNPVSQNLTKLLIQGLHSKDKKIILTVLQNNNDKVAKSTVSNLPADYIPMLVEQLAAMATKNTDQCASVCTWMNALLQAHSALLLATITSQQTQHLAQLLAIFTQRRSHLCQLLNLKGRLDLTVTQRNTCQQIREEQEAVLQYNDSSSDEMEVEQYQSDSAHSWNESDEASAPEESGDEEGHESDGD